MAANRVIGRDNKLPWHLPSDLQHFKALTMGHPLIMGRKTFQSIGKPLPGRRTIVLSRDPSFAHDGVDTASTLDEALRLLSPEATPFVAGGGQVYAEALTRADRVFLTVLHEVIHGDARFPHLDMKLWQVVRDEFRAPDAQNPFPTSFRRYERRRL